MNSGAIKKLVFSGSKKYEPNTFIGGVASTITSASAIANVLGVPENWIKNFAIVGDDIEFHIKKGYEIPSRAFGTNSNQNPPRHPEITYFHDTDGKVTLCGSDAFHKCDMNGGFRSNGVKVFGNSALRETNQKHANYPELIEMRGGAFFDGKLETFIAPKCEILYTAEFGSNDINFSLVDIRSAKTLGSVNYPNFFQNSSGSKRARFQVGAIVKAHEDVSNNAGILYAKSEGATIKLYDDNGDYVSTL